MNRILPAVLLLCAACSDSTTASPTGDTGGTPDPAYFGSYDTNFGGQFSVDAMDLVDGGATYAVLSFDDTRVIAQNDSTNEFNPDLYSAFDFATDGNLWFVCQAAFSAESAEAAEQAAPSDATDPATGGCGGMFSWTELTATP